MDQSSGVSARMPISAIEILVSNLERRGLKNGEKRVSPRLCDLPATLPAITGKVEMVYEGEQQGAEVVAKKLIGAAVKKLFDARFPAPDSGPPHAAAPRGAGGGGRRSPAGAARPAPPRAREDPPRCTSRSSSGSRPATRSRSPTTRRSPSTWRRWNPCRACARRSRSTSLRPLAEERAVGMELVLEGLTQHLKIAREDLDSKVSYMEMLKFNLVRSRRTRPHPSEPRHPERSEGSAPRSFPERVPRERAAPRLLSHVADGGRRRSPCARGLRLSSSSTPSTASSRSSPSRRW